MDMHAKQKKLLSGFSLVEILVIIAIVGILVTIALPAYKQYRIKGMVASVMPILDKLMNEVITFAERKGLFPGSFSELGYDAANGGVIQGIQFPSYVKLIGMSNYASSYGLCSIGNKVTIITLIFKESAIHGYLEIDCFVLYEAAKTYTKMCTYLYSDNLGTSYGGDVFPGLLNWHTGSQYDYDNYNNFRGSAVQNAVCISGAP